MKPIYFNFLVLTIAKEASVDDIEFIQTIVDAENGKYLVEIKKIIAGIKYLYRLENLEWNDVLKIFYDLCINRKAPDLFEWEDVSDKIFKDRHYSPEDN